MASCKVATPCHHPSQTWGPCSFGSATVGLLIVLGQPVNDLLASALDVHRNHVFPKMPSEHMDTIQPLWTLLEAIDRERHVMVENPNLALDASHLEAPFVQILSTGKTVQSEVLLHPSRAQAVVTLGSTCNIVHAEMGEVVAVQGQIGGASVGLLIVISQPVNDFLVSDLDFCHNHVFPKMLSEHTDSVQPGLTLLMGEVPVQHLLPDV